MISIKELLERKAKDLYTVTSTELVQAALEILASRKIGAVLVIDQGKLVGILSERDCALKVAMAGKRADETRVADVMTAAVVSVDSKQTLDECMTQMNTRDIRHLPVVEGGQVIGMVSVGDVSKELMREKVDLIGYLETYVNRGFRL